MDHAKRYLDDVEMIEDPYECVRDADAVVLMTEWDSLRKLDLKRVRNLVRHPVFVDLRNAYRAGLVEKFGFSYTGIGLGVERTVTDVQEMGRSLANPEMLPAMHRTLSHAQTEVQALPIVR
jgi:UDPglucose 6-dehydrogenase